MKALEHIVSLLFNKLMEIIIASLNPTYINSKKEEEMIKNMNDLFFE